MRGLSSHSRECRNIFDELFSKHFAKFLAEFTLVRIDAVPVFAPARMQENKYGEYFMYWFRARGGKGKDKSKKEVENSKEQIEMEDA